jgi:hypothetical protein
MYEPDTTELAPVLQKEFPGGYAILDKRLLKSGALVCVKVGEEQHLLLIKDNVLRSHQITHPERRQLSVYA